MPTKEALVGNRLVTGSLRSSEDELEVVVEMGPERRYAKPYAVAVSLELLRGPTTGVVLLPRHLDWSGLASYDLEAPGRIVDLYRAVLIEAASPDDLHTYLDEATLKRLWSYLWLPPALRSAWEETFPPLAELSRLAAAG